MTRHHTNQSQWVIWKYVFYLSCYYGTCFPKQIWICAYLTLGSSLFDRFKYILFVFFLNIQCVVVVCLFVFVEPGETEASRMARESGSCHCKAWSNFPWLWSWLWKLGFYGINKNNILCTRLTKNKEIRIFNLPALLEKIHIYELFTKFCFQRFDFLFLCTIIIPTLCAITIMYVVKYQIFLFFPYFQVEHFTRYGMHEYLDDEQLAKKLKRPPLKPHLQVSQVYLLCGQS